MLTPLIDTVGKMLEVGKLRRYSQMTGTITQPSVNSAPVPSLH